MFITRDEILQPLLYKHTHTKLNSVKILQHEKLFAADDIIN